jgi:hypothetical protein
MVRSLFLLVLGAAVGAVAVWIVNQSPQPSGSPIVTPEPALLRCEAELQRRDAELHELRKVNVGATAGVVPTVPAHVHSESGSAEDSDEQSIRQAAAWRISAIEKFVPLSDEQRSRLTEKFAEERKAREEGRESSAESLEDILGEENAQVYRGQVKAAFERVQNEELEKDTVWMARRLGLSPEQEGRMRAAFEGVERDVAAEYPPSQPGASDSPQQRVLRMIAENKRRVQLRAERLRQVLPPEQYEAYMKAESESAASDMEVFHGSGEEDSGEVQQAGR